jgi:regulator of PEP synthase PpsR (kinase-PPPase family)
MELERTVYFVSDRTGITVETLGQSILSQFRTVRFSQITIPFVDSIEKARETAEVINRAAADSGVRPIVLSTLVDPEMVRIISQCTSLFLDCLGSFLVPLEAELGVPSTHTIGVSHSTNDWVMYHQRIEAVNFSLGHDDGLGVRELGSADVVLIGVSRSGKTPTCLYLALQFGIRAANYPLTPEDLKKHTLPEPLRGCRPKLFGLTINPQRLHQIRSERMANSEYASLPNCVAEIRDAERILLEEQIPVLDTTTKSIEELSTMILQKAKLKRQIF